MDPPIGDNDTFIVQINGTEEFCSFFGFEVLDPQGGFLNLCFVSMYAIFQ